MPVQSMFVVTYLSVGRKKSLGGNGINGMKFGQLILRKISKTVANRCQVSDFKAKMHQNRFPYGLIFELI